MILYVFLGVLSLAFAFNEAIAPAQSAELARANKAHPAGAKDFLNEPVSSRFDLDTFTGKNRWESKKRHCKTTKTSLNLPKPIKNLQKHPEKNTSKLFNRVKPFKYRTQTHKKKLLGAYLLTNLKTQQAKKTPV